MYLLASFQCNSESFQDESHKNTLIEVIKILRFRLGLVRTLKKSAVSQFKKLYRAYC